MFSVLSPETWGVLGMILEMASLEGLVVGLRGGKESDAWFLGESPNRVSCFLKAFGRSPQRKRKVEVAALEGP